MLSEKKTHTSQLRAPSRKSLVLKVLREYTYSWRHPTFFFSLYNSSTFYWNMNKASSNIFVHMTLTLTHVLAVTIAIGKNRW